jgi:nicotinate phosphoribosyltransferase
VTCQSQPALGCVYKLVEIDNQPRIKLSQEVEKTVIPGKKNVYRLIGSTLPDCPVIDVIQLATAPAPVAGQRLLCRHPFQENKRAHVVPTQVIEMLHLFWDGETGGKTRPLDTIEQIRDKVATQLAALRPDHRRTLNPTPYKVAVDAQLYDFMHTLWMSEAPINDLS